MFPPGYTLARSAFLAEIALVAADHPPIHSEGPSGAGSLTQRKRRSHPCAPRGPVLSTSRRCGMPPELVAWLVLGFLALVALHELTHVLIARLHGHPTVCVAINPVGVAVVFEDSPRARYWLLQVILPAIVSWAICYVWLYGLFT